jgi:hypothetical protein
MSNTTRRTRHGIAARSNGCGQDLVGRRTHLVSLRKHDPSQTWCPTTSFLSFGRLHFDAHLPPQPPGTAAASLRGDEVIHDDAKEVSVTLHLEVPPPCGLEGFCVLAPNYFFLHRWTVSRSQCRGRRGKEPGPRSRSRASRYSPHDLASIFIIIILILII